MSPAPDMADPQQVIADLERRLAERTTERDEAVAQQTATAEVLGVINASPGDPTPVFDAMLEKALRLCEASFGSLQIYEGERFHAAATHGGTPELDDFMRIPRTARPEEGLGRIARGEDLVHIADVRETDSYRSG